jgi:hypothetical protein
MELFSLSGVAHLRLCAHCICQRQPTTLLVAVGSPRLLVFPFWGPILGTRQLPARLRVTRWLGLSGAGLWFRLRCCHRSQILVHLPLTSTSAWPNCEFASQSPPADPSQEAALQLQWSTSIPATKLTLVLIRVRGTGLHSPDGWAIILETKFAIAHPCWTAVIDPVDAPQCSGKWQRVTPLSLSCMAPEAQRECSPIRSKSCPWSQIMERKAAARMPPAMCCAKTCL